MAGAMAGLAAVGGQTRTAACSPAPSTMPPPRPCSTRDAIISTSLDATPRPTHAKPNITSPAINAARASRPGTNRVPKTSIMITPTAALSMNTPI